MQIQWMDSQIASALRDLINDGLLAFTGAAWHPTCSTSELVNATSSLHFPAGEAATHAYTFVK